MRVASRADCPGRPDSWFSAVRGIRLGPPDDILESSRWIFLLLTLASGLVVLPQAFLARSAPTAVLAVTASAVLAGSAVRTYRRRYQGWSEEAVELLAVAAFASCTTQPTAVFGVIFGRLWLRALYGARWVALSRPAAYLVAVAVGLLLHPVGPVRPSAVTPLVLASFFPILVLTGMVGRRLASSLHAGAENAQLDAIQVRLGADVLGVTDRTEIHRAAWRAHAAMCAVVPDLRLVVIVMDGTSLMAERADGRFVRPPAEVPAPTAGLLAATTRLSSSRDPSVAALNAAAGASCSWVWVEMTDLAPREDRAWIALGAPREVPARALVALAAQTNHVGLALRYCELHESLTEQATRDTLTSLCNRASFLTTLSGSLGADAEGPTSVLFIDLDDFKRVNDHFGHQAGDVVLQEVARRLRSAAGPSAECGRIGGDEFAVLLPGAAAEDAVATARRIAAALAGATHPDGSPMHIGACVGIATSDGDAGAEELVHRADLAMYVAKSAGRGQISSYDCTLPRRDGDQAAFEWRLGGAARAGELVVHYQPVLSLPDHRCTAVEALVRWQHPDRGLLPPSLVIDIAERTGAIRSIGAAVLRQAVQDTARWHRELPGQPLAVHVNVAVVQLEDDDLLAQVSDALEEFSVDPRSLVIEVTESLAISSPDAVRRLHTLAERGVVLAIDDFGTGYSALQTLCTLPIQIVKIDRSFVDGSTHNPEDRAVTEAIVQMARRLGLRTVAEGVERPEQEAFLESIGATGAQGYLYRKPGTADELSGWLAEHLAARSEVPHQASIRTDGIPLAR